MIRLKRLLEVKSTKAAGILAVASDTKRFLLGLRSQYISEGNTWGIPGGKMDPNERDPISTAIREFKEETRFNGPIQPIPAYIYKGNSITYYNFIAVVQNEFKAYPDWETERFGWFTLKEIQGIKNLHTGVDVLLGNSTTMNIINNILNGR